MTPHEQKAREFFDKMRNSVVCADQYGDVSDHHIDEATKIVCETAIDEIIDACRYNGADMYNQDWWEKVKEEIQKL